jgi:hypothetical protein
MHREVERAYVQTLTEWAAHYRREQSSGAEEVAFLMERVARIIAKKAGLEIADLPPEPRPREVPVTEVRDG